MLRETSAGPVVSVVSDVSVVSVELVDGGVVDGGVVDGGVVGKLACGSDPAVVTAGPTSTTYGAEVPEQAASIRLAPSNARIGTTRSRARIAPTSRCMSPRYRPPAAPSPRVRTACFRHV